MANTPLNNTWEWRVLLVECPECRMSCSPEGARIHANWHWLTSTETETLTP